MALPRSGSDDDTASGELVDLLASWRRHLVAQRQPGNLPTYSAAIRAFDAYLGSRGMPRTVVDLQRQLVEAFITQLLADWRPATAHNRYRALRSFFGWLVEEGEIAESPMLRTKPPRLPEAPPPVLREPQLRHLLEVCERDRTTSSYTGAERWCLKLDTNENMRSMVVNRPSDDPRDIAIGAALRDATQIAALLDPSIRTRPGGWHIQASQPDVNRELYLRSLARYVEVLGGRLEELGGQPVAVFPSIRIAVIFSRQA